MQIPTNWHYFETRGTVQTTTAFLHTAEFTLQVTHKTRDLTLVQVREPGFEGFDFQGHSLDSGAHRSPAEAFRFAEAFLADGGDDFRRDGRGVSPRYSRAVAVAYAR